MFQSGVKDVARLLIGKTIVLPGGRQAIVRGTKPFARKDNEAGIYRPLLDMEPGSVYAPRHRNALLVLVAALDSGNRGGCVLVSEVEIDGQSVKGPGRVASAIGITQHGTAGTLQEQAGGSLRLWVDGPLEPKMPRGNGKGEALTDADIASCFARLGAIYQRDAKPEDTIEAFIARIKEEHTTKESFDAWLKKQEG